MQDTEIYICPNLARGECLKSVSLLVYLFALSVHSGYVKISTNGRLGVERSIEVKRAGNIYSYITFVILSLNEANR